MKCITLAVAVCAAVFSLNVTAQWCPEKNIQYWQGFPPGGESDQSARQQQLVLKRKCPGIETIVQYKPGASGGLMWSQMNSLPGDGYNIVGVTLPHIVLQPMEGQVQYKTEDITPIYWFRYMADAIVVPEQSPIKTYQDLIRIAKEQPGKLTLAMGITRRHNGRDVTRGNLYVCESEHEEAFETGVSARIGIRHAADWPLRFYIAGNRYVSK